MMIQCLTLVTVLLFFAPTSRAIADEGDDCIQFLTAFSAPVSRSENTDPGYPQYIEAIEKLFDTLAEQEVDFVKLEKVLREDWLVIGQSENAMSKFTENKIRSAFLGSSPFVKLTHDFFSSVSAKLTNQHELSSEIRNASLTSLQNRMKSEAKSKEDVHAVVQKISSSRFEATSTGAVFEPGKHLSLGSVVIAPNGLMWSAALPGIYKNEGTLNGDEITDSAAVKACEKIGGRLPSQEEYDGLRKYFDLQQRGQMTMEGQSDLQRIFPDMIGKWFWASSVRPRGSIFGYAFNCFHGSEHYPPRHNENSVLCVAR